MREFALGGRLAYASTGMPNYKRYLDEMPGVPLQNLRADIPYPPGDVSSREYRVRARSLEAAKRKLATALSVPEWTLRWPARDRRGRLRNRLLPIHPVLPPRLDAPHGRAHSARMAVPFDTLAATEAMESVGMDPRQARVFAAQLIIVSRTSDTVTRPEPEAALAKFKTALIERITEFERALMGRLDHIAENQHELAEPVAEREYRYSARLWRLFGGIVAVAGLAVSAIKYLP